MEVNSSTPTAGPDFAQLFNATSVTTSVSSNLSQCNLTLNRTEIELMEHHMPMIMAVSKILPPMWWIIGTIGNIMALLVWLQPKMRHSSGCYLAALAITDLCFLPLNIIFEINFTYSHSILDKPILCEWFAISYLSVQYMSPLFVLAFTIERYLSVCHPFRMVNFNQSNIRVTIFTILGLALICIGINGAQGYFWTTEQNNLCDMRKSASEAWTAVSWTTEMLIFAAVPLTVLILNILVIMEVRNISHLERRNMRTKSIDRRSTTLMLLGVSFYLILTVLPVTVMYVLYYQFPTGDPCMTDEQIDNDPTWAAYFHYMGVKIIIQNIGMSHYAANFFIYVMTGKLFRKQLYEMLIVFFCKEKLLYLTSRTGAYASTRTTRMSLTSHRGSIGRGRLGSKTNSDPCNNDTDLSNKNSYTYSAVDPGVSAASTEAKVSVANGRLLTCVEESDTDLSDREEVLGQQGSKTS